MTRVTVRVEMQMAVRMLMLMRRGMRMEGNTDVEGTL